MQQLDKLSAYRVPQIAEMICQTEAKWLYLPPYSPNFNPIENYSSKLKYICANTEH